MWQLTKAHTDCPALITTALGQYIYTLSIYKLAKESGSAHLFFVDPVAYVYLYVTDDLKE